MRFMFIYRVNPHTVSFTPSHSQKQKNRLIASAYSHLPSLLFTASRLARLSVSNPNHQLIHNTYSTPAHLLLTSDASHLSSHPPSLLFTAWRSARLDVSNPNHQPIHTSLLLFSQRLDVFIPNHQPIRSSHLFSSQRRDWPSSTSRDRLIHTVPFTPSHSHR